MLIRWLISTLNSAYDVYTTVKDSLELAGLRMHLSACAYTSIQFTQ